MVDRQSSHNDTGRARPLPPPQLHNVTAITRARHSMDVQSRSTTSHHEEDWSWHEAHTPDAPTTPSSPASPQRSQGRVAYASSGSHGNTQLTPRSPRHNRVDSAVSRRPSNSPSRTTSMTEGGGGGASSNRPASLFRSNFLARGGHITASMSTAWTPETAFGRNAISSLLNAPNTKSKSTTSYLTSSWLPMSTGAAGGAALPRPETPPVQPTVIRRVRPEEFQTYLAGIKGPWSDYEHNRGASERLAHPIAEIPPLPAVPLSIIPAVFFEEDFNLSDPETFTATLKLAANVLNREPVVNAIQPDLIDWYSQHLDTVEAHLLREVAMRSSSFFAALAALRNLHSQSTSSVTRTRELRSMLATITRDRVLPILKVIQQSRRRDPITDTAVKSDTSKQQQQQQQIWIVNYLFKELEQLELSARTAMEDELVRLVTNYLTNICTKAMTFTPDQHGKQQEDHNDMIDRTLPDDLARSMQILAPTTGFTTTTMAALVSSIVTLTNDMFTKSVSPNTSVDQLLTTESLTSVEEFAFTDKVALTQSMQSMTLDAFIELLDTILVVIRNKSTLDGSPPQKLKESTELSSKSNAELEIMAENEPHPLQFAAISHLAVHVRCTHLIQLRQQHIEQLSAKDFYRLFIPGDTFVRRSCDNLLKTLAIGFLNTFHTERRRQLATLIAGEQWVPCDVPPEFQQFADAIVSGHGELPTPTTATHNSSSSSGSTNVKLESNEEEKDKSTTNNNNDSTS
ncbi:hypothetical protein BDF22DRAFT_699852 [Syncephalis plumigaleata]|nr:hypothetical protein BDF22DRAFT_699852 [Syncephalis plumigaleata]